MQDPIHIAFVFDESSIDFLKVALFSLSENTKSDLCIYGIDLGISETKRSELINFLVRCRRITSFAFLPPDEEVLQEHGTILPPYYFRFVLQKMLPPLKRILYLDCHIVVDSDIRELWDLDLGDKTFAALHLTDLELHPQEIASACSCEHFDFGVLLIDLQKAHPSSFFQEIISQETQESSSTTLSAAALTEYLPLSPRFNFLPFAEGAKDFYKENGPIVIFNLESLNPQEINYKIFRICQKIRLFPYATSVFFKFWKYQMAISNKRMASSQWLPTFKWLRQRCFRNLRFFKLFWERTTHFFKGIFRKKNH